jgi:putative zinc finger protein
MKETTCERAPDLMAFLYQEMDERETREFRLHLQQCNSCCQEVTSLAVVRESITTWRDEALAGFVSTPVTPKPGKSAIAALRQFFDLSPLWLKGATAFAMVAFFVVAALALVKLQTTKVPTTANADVKYTEQDVDRFVKEALAKQDNKNKSVEPVAVVESPRPKTSKVSPRSQLAKNRRPLSKAEREQLAADLRLLSTQEDASLYLLGDRINQ